LPLGEWLTHTGAIFRMAGFLGIFSRSGSGSRNTLELEAKVNAISRSQAVIEFALDGTIVAANQNFLSALGYAEQEIIGKHHRMFVDRDYAESADYRQFWQRLNRGEFIAEKFLRFAKGGKEIWIQASYNPLLGADGKPFKVIKFATDVTAIELERRTSEQERAERSEQQAQIVRSLAGGLKALADGDLTKELNDRFPGEYEGLRADFNRTVGALRDAMISILASAGAVRNGTNEITIAADDLSKRTEQTAANLEETAAALNELTTSVKETAVNARQASGTVATTRGDAEKSGEIVKQAVTAMEQIEKSSEHIGQIIGVIDEIAFQTNLLALNAGVEAARAGEAGRGFAVVAQEVRALAQRSAEAAKEIKTLISASGQHVATGVKLVGSTGESLFRIVGAIANISDLMNQMAGVAETQSASLAQINTAISQMEQTTQQNSAMGEESAAAAGSLAKEAASMADLVSRFEVDAGRSTGTVVPLQKAAAPRASQASKVASYDGHRSAAVRKPQAAQETDTWEDF
jgi:methyl-accepting chemotaxis protein